MLCNRFCLLRLFRIASASFIQYRSCSRSTYTSKMATDNLTALLYQPKDLRLVQTPIPEIADDEVLLRMDCVGICGSDVHYWQSGACGHFVLKAPMVMGHEGSGVVAKLGAKVTSLKVGDRVAIEPGVPCRLCALCKTGRYHLCADMVFCATPPVHGNLVRYYKHAADFCFKLPDHVSMEEGALMEPLAVALHACRRGGVAAGDAVLVLGAGPIGLLTMLAAKAMGAAKVLITDVLQSRLDFAKSIGADATLLVSRDSDEAELVTKVHELLGEQPNVSFDASGAQATVRLALQATRSGGVAVLVGMGAPEQTVPLAAALTREVDIRGIFRYVNEYPIALAMLASGKINVKPLVTHHYTIEETLDAYEVARKGEGIKEKWPMPIISENEVLIKIECVGICGSDVKLYSTGKCGPELLTEPVVLGHEGAGVVVQVGEDVKDLKVGDRVAIEPTQPCRACRYCKLGKYNLCARPAYCSTAGGHGNLARYYKHVADFCHKIPEGLSMEEGAAVQPLAIAIHACNRANIKIGSKLAIMGAGPIGILCAMSAKAMGASKIVITDVVQSRLDTALELGADYTLLTSKEDTDEQIVKRITELLGDQPDISIDACGYAVAQRVAMTVTKSAGLVLVVGIGEDSVTVPLTPALLREVDVRGSFRIANTYPAALAAVSSGAIPLKKFITSHLPLEKTKEALELAKTGSEMKIIIHVQN